MYKTVTNKTCLKSFFYGIDLFNIRDFVKEDHCDTSSEIRKITKWIFLRGVDEWDHQKGNMVTGPPFQNNVPRSKEGNPLA